MIQTLPEKPPRGHCYALARLSHVAGGPMRVERVLGRRESSLSALAPLLKSIDPRLQPHIVAVEFEP